MENNAFMAVDMKKESDEPNSYQEIFFRKDKDEWITAINNELNNMKKMNVYTPIKKLPKGVNVISTRWVFKNKHDANGRVYKKKARLVARGFTQQYGIDYKETFAPTLKQDTIRIITSIAAKNNYNIHQLDIKAAYLNAKLNEDIYMELPEGDDHQGMKYCKLSKALYGLKQAGRMWNDTLNEALIDMNFNRLLSEPCLYVKRNAYNKIICLLGVYVDDILITGENKEILKVKRLLKDKFDITDTGYVDFIVGIKFVKCKDGYLIHQKRYLNDIFKKFNIDKLKPCSNMIPINNKKLKEKSFNSTKYRQAVGNLLYLAICTRPDILFSVSKASRKNQNPNYEDWFNVFKIFRYLKYTPNYGIKFSKNDNYNFEVYVDADLGGDPDTRKSTTGYVMTINSGPVSWYFKLQNTVAVSTAESEYYGIHECTHQCLWL